MLSKTNKYFSTFDLNLVPVSFLGKVFISYIVSYCCRTLLHG